MRLQTTVVFFVVYLVPIILMGQYEDCNLAQVICSDGPVSFNSEGSGINDFQDPDNHAGCLLTGENQSSWYYFAFTQDMPANSLLEFTLEPVGGFTEDYDFAIYGPNEPCDDLGFPVRCSFANFLCDLCPLTGLGMGATDNSEEAQGEDGFVAPLMVQPGEGYYLILDNWYGSSDGFTLTWGGSAAPFLNCNANPNCINLAVNAGMDLNVCAGDSLVMTADLSNASPNATVVWTDSTGANLLLSDSMALQPTFFPPDDFSGAVTFTITVTDGDCQKSDQVTIGVDSIPIVQIEGEALHCPNTTVSLNGEVGYSTYQWSNDSTTQSIEIDTAGTYWLTAVDMNGCMGADTLIVEEAVVELPVIEGLSQICQGDSALFSLNTDYEIYQWSDGSIDSTLTAFTTNDYSVEVTDRNGCIFEAFFTLTATPLPQPMISGQDSICEGEMTTLDVGAGFETYLWSNGGEDPEIQTDLEGTYGVTVTDAVGCIGETSFNLAVREPQMPIVNVGPAFCPGDSTPVLARGGFLSYLWENGDTDNMTYAHDGGTLNLTVIDEYGCEGSLDIGIDQYAAPEPEILGDTAFCVGNSVHLTSNQVYPEYLWSDGSSGDAIDVNSPGIVELTVRDENGCRETASLNIEMNPLPVFAISGEDSYCETESTLLTVPAGFSTYLWSDGSQDTMLYVDNPGAYGLTITDTNGCQDEMSIDVVENALPQPQIMGALNYCPGTSTTLAINANYVNYNWSDGSDNPTLLVENPGNYSVTVTDDNNCQGITSEIINEFPEVTMQIEGDSAYCAGQSSLLAASGSYNAYLWSDNSMLSSLEVSTPGTFGLTVTDANGCQAIDELTVVENALPVPLIQGGNGYCPAETLNLSTAQNWESFLWSNGVAGPGIMVNTPGLYMVTVTDNNGCMGTTSQNVEAFPEPTPQILGDLQFCPQTETILSVNNNYASYQWSDNSTAPSLMVQSAGTYGLTVTDNNGCMATAMEEVSNFNVFAPQISERLGFCAGQSIEVDAGSGYQTYLWSDGTSAQTLEINQADAYGVTVIDQNDCESFMDFVVEEYQLPQPDIQSVEGLCPGENTTLSSSGSFETYLWSDGTQEPNLLMAIPGTYSLLVTDSNGCEGMDEVEILAYQTPMPQILGLTEICPNDTTQLTLSETYVSYQWTGGVQTPNLEVFQPGIIEVEVLSTEGCVGQTSLEISGLAAPEFEIDGDTTFCAGGNTILSVPDQFSTYQWAPSGEFPELQVNQAGDYAVTVMNNVGCTSSQSISIAEIALPEPDHGIDQTLDCNSQTVRLGGAMPLPSERYQYTWSGPGIDAQNRNLPQPQVDIQGIYELIVEDLLYACFSASLQVEVTDLSYEPIVEIAPTAQLNCNTESTLVDGSASESRPSIQYHWFDANGLLSITNEAVYTVEEGGWYYLEVLDTLTGCQARDSSFVEEDRLYPEVQIELPGILNCYDSTLTLNGGNSSNGPDFDLQWTSNNGHFLSGENSTSPIIDAPGWYILNIQNEFNHCLTQDSVLVAQNMELPLVSAGGDQDLDCVQREINLDGSASSTGPNIRYHWTDETGNPLAGADLLHPLVNQEGTYYLTVTNLENGCAAIDEVLIEDVADYPTLAEIDLVHPACFGENDGQINITTVENGTPPFFFALDDQIFSEQGTFQQLSAGSYNLSVEDALGCNLTIPVSIEEGSRIEIDLGADQHIDLGETLELNPDLVLPGIGIVQYDRVNLEGDTCKNCTEWELRPFQTQEVQVIATDEQGCKTSDYVTIYVAHPDEVFIPNAFSPNNDGLNDLFMVYSGEDVQLIRSILILDRWGGNVFEASNLAPNEENQGWDGKIRGQLGMPSVYVYVIEVEFIDGDIKMFKGDVTLIR